MYVFTMDGHFDKLLDLSFEYAERYAIRRMAVCGEKPSYRTAYGIAPEYHTVAYGTIPDYDEHGHSHAELRLITPLSSLKGEKAWKEGGARDAFPDWEKFIKEAQENSGDYNGGDYYQWPWPIPSE